MIKTKNNKKIGMVLSTLLICAFSPLTSYVHINNTNVDNQAWTTANYSNKDMLKSYGLSSVKRLNIYNDTSYTYLDNTNVTISFYNNNVLVNGKDVTDGNDGWLKKLPMTGNYDPFYVTTAGIVFTDDGSKVIWVDAEEEDSSAYTYNEGVYFFNLNGDILAKHNPYPCGDLTALDNDNIFKIQGKYYCTENFYQVDYENENVMFGPYDNLASICDNDYSSGIPGNFSEPVVMCFNNQFFQKYGFKNIKSSMYAKLMVYLQPGGHMGFSFIDQMTGNFIENTTFSYNLTGNDVNLSFEFPKTYNNFYREQGDGTYGGITTYFKNTSPFFQKLYIHIYYTDAYGKQHADIKEVDRNSKPIQSIIHLYHNIIGNNSNSLNNQKENVKFTVSGENDSNNEKGIELTDSHFKENNDAKTENKFYLKDTDPSYNFFFDEEEGFFSNTTPWIANSTLYGNNFIANVSNTTSTFKYQGKAQEEKLAINGKIYIKKGNTWNISYDFRQDANHGWGKQTVDLYDKTSDTSPQSSLTEWDKNTALSDDNLHSIFIAQSNTTLTWYTGIINGEVVNVIDLTSKNQLPPQVEVNLTANLFWGNTLGHGDGGVSDNGDTSNLYYQKLDNNFNAINGTKQELGTYNYDKGEYTANPVWLTAKGLYQVNIGDIVGHNAKVIVNLDSGANIPNAFRNITNSNGANNGGAIHKSLPYFYILLGAIGIVAIGWVIGYRIKSGKSAKLRIQKPSKLKNKKEKNIKEGNCNET